MSLQLKKCRKSLLAAAAVAALTAVTALTGAATAHAAAATAATDQSVSTLRTGDGFDVLIGGQARLHLAQPEKSDGVVTAAGPGHVAVIPDHDGSRGSRLMTYDTRTGRTRTLARGKVVSAAFSPDGTRLAYTVAGQAGADLYAGSAEAPGRRIAAIPGARVEVVGLSGDASTAFVAAYPDARDDRRYAASLLRVALADGAVTPLIASDPAHGQVYADFRLVTGERQLVSFIRRSGPYLCSGRSELGLAGLDGRTVATYGASSGTAYREAVWSGDGDRVAYAAQPCASQSKAAADPAATAARTREESGTFVARVSGGAPVRVVSGVTSEFGIGGFDGDRVRLASARLGERTVGADAVARGVAQPLAAASLDGVSRSLAGGRTNRAVHINQIYDTRDEFDGRGSCGPTTAVMTMAGYQLGEWGLWVNYGGRHYSPYGRYVTDQYDYNGSTFSETAPDYSGNGAWQGAHGTIYDPRYGAVWADMFGYMNRHTGWTRKSDWNPTFVRDQIDIGNLVAVSGQMTSAGHIVLIKGYTDDGRWVVNDPYGPNTNGGPGGADQVYDTAYLRPVQVWGN
ncbi:C39 family peptidase [Nonomuraea sp. NPDC049637]|uniref:C39 family peptidase n=1 Tax=Nonomuraea sp. NPDC049637 TaxID=3154356 RepID=UPI0034221FD3